MSPYQRHTPPEAEAALDELTLALAEYRRRTLETARDLLVAIRACLDSGATWGEVGRQLGMTKQAARARWAPYLDQMIAEERRQAWADGRLRPGLRGADGATPAAWARRYDESHEP
jgi:hypothetical protein